MLDSLVGVARGTVLQGGREGAHGSVGPSISGDLIGELPLEEFVF